MSWDWDPQVSRGMSCLVCEEWQADDQEDVDAEGVCWDCVDAAEYARMDEEDDYV